MRAAQVLVLGLVFGLAGSAAMAASDPAMTCDTLAGSPLDADLPEGIGGVAFDRLDPTDEAEAACLAALGAAPNQRRFYAHLGRLYTKREKYRQAFEAYRIASGRGSAIAANNLGAMYNEGQGRPVDAEKGTHFFRKAAHRGLPAAMQSVATRARTGQGMQKNMMLAFFWYEKAYNAGHLQAVNDLGVMYQQGYGVREDDVRAVALFTESLERDPGHAIAAWNLAEAYETGEGVEADLERARGYYVAAFHAGDADAASEVARFEADGLVYEPDAAAAVDWNARGAAAGSLYATVGLAEAYENGSGVLADLAEAGSLYRAALDLDPNDEWWAYITERLAALAVPDNPKATD